MPSCCDVSVVIPTYNRLPFLKAALESVFSQSLLPCELIVVDDGSDDGTHEYLDGLHHDIVHVQILHQKNQGVAASRNRAAAHAKSTWLAFLDSDDQWLPKKLEYQIGFLVQHPQYSICQTEEIWIRNGKRVNPQKKHAKHSGDIFEACLKLCIVSPSAVMIKKDFFDILGGFDEDYEVCEDYELWLRASLKAPIITLDKAYTLKYGGHSDQLSRKHWGMDRFRVRAMEKILSTCDLTARQRGALLGELHIKLKILSVGFSKRYPSELNPYLEKVRWLKNNTHSYFSLL